ncbi:MAG: hypothetical protein ACJ786_34075 [Catenulispora sp.]
MSDLPTPEQSFSIHLKSLLDFAGEFTTQIESIQAPMDHLATMSASPPQYGAFAEAWSLGAGEQAAIEEMYSLLGQVKQAIAFAGDVTGTVADGYRHADENIALALGAPVPLGAPAPTGSHSHDSGHPVSDRPDNPWQGVEVTASQILFPDPGPPGPPDPGSWVPQPLTNANDVLGAQVAGGPQSVWTPPPAQAAPPGPEPSWTDYFQGFPQGGA